MAGNRVVNFHPRARRGGRLAVLDGARARRSEGRSAHLCKPVGFAVRPPGDGALLVPAGSVPVHREAVEQEARPALPHPPRPPSRVDRAAVQLALVLATAARGPTAKERREACRRNMRCRRQRASPGGLRPPGGQERGRTAHRSRLLRRREGRSPPGSPLPWGMAGDAEELGALRRPQALSSAAKGGLREGLTPPPRFML